MAKIFGACSVCHHYGPIVRGWCHAHYLRWYRYGDPLKGGRVNASKHRMRKIIIDGERGLIPLTRGYVAVIDRADAEEVGQYNWVALPDDRCVYAATNLKGTDGTRRRVMLHAFLMGHKEGWIVDHKDGDGLNNRRENLRFATHTQNQANKRVGKNNRSGFKGVRFASWARGEKRWRANISVNGRHRYLGYYASPEEAARAYDAAARACFGEFAKTNFDEAA